jgi:hypothetical protein
MTDVSEGQWRWPLPDDWEPEGFWCVQLTIPGDQQYFDRLTGALGLLTLSKSWFPDPTRAGPAAVAYAWENALYLNPFIVTENCIAIPPIPIPDEAAAADQAAGVFIKFYAYLVDQLNTNAPTEPDCPDAVDGIMTTLAPYGATDAVRGALQRLCTDLQAPGVRRASYVLECPYVPLFDDLKAKIRDNPYDWLNKLTDWMFDWLNTTSDTIMNDLNMVAGLLGGQAVEKFVQDNGGGGGGATFGDDCGYTHSFLFATGDGGWFPATLEGQDRGHYNTDNSWGSSYNHYVSSNADVQLLEILRDVASGAVTDVEVIYSGINGDHDVGAPPLVMEIYVDGTAVTSQPLTNGLDQVIAWHSGTAESFTELSVFFRVGYTIGTGHNPGGIVLVSRINVSGPGDDPFV